MFFDPMWFVFLAPAMLLAAWAQMRVRGTYSAAAEIPAPLSGAAAARHILDSAGLHDVEIEPVPGHLTDHYDPRQKVLRLSDQNYQSRTVAAVGIAAHEAGHAIQDAHGYAPLIVRNAAVPVASFGSGFGMLIIMLGFMLQALLLVKLGIFLFGAVVFFQLVNLPVEFNASNRAKQLLPSLGIANQEQMIYVNKVLNAAAWTYVAATLEAVLTLAYFIFRFSGSNRQEEY
jgi:uncharacterized protein